MAETNKQPTAGCRRDPRRDGAWDDEVDMGEIRLTYLTGVVLHAIASGHRYGFDIMDATGIPDGTVYPALRRLADAGLLEARWEDADDAARLNRPPRKYYRLTAEGANTHGVALERFPGIAHTFGGPAPETSGG